MSSETLILSQKTRSVLLPPTMFDNAAIIASSGSDTGFPISNLKDFQPKRKWHHSPGGDPIATHFVVDLGASSPGRVWNCAIPLFHNGFQDPEINRWRIQTGDAPSGTGFYDSDWMPLWDSPTAVSGSANNYQAPAFYRNRGLGAHSHFILPRQQISGGESANYLLFRGGNVDFGDVLDAADVAATTDMMQILTQVRLAPEVSHDPAFTYTILQKGISNVLTGASGFGGGYSVALRQESGQPSSIIVTYNDGSDAMVFDTATFGGFLQVGWNDIAVSISFAGLPPSISIWLNGAAALTDSLGTVMKQDTGSPLVWGENSTGGQVAQIDVERVVFGSGISNDQFNGVFAADIRSMEFPSTWAAGYPIDTGFGTTVEDVGPSSFNGAMSGDVTWNTGSTPNLLFNRYARFDFESENTPTWTMGRFFMGLALEPITPYGTAIPTPLGTPPKPQVTWPTRMTRDQFESIAYALAADSGNNPDVLESWGHDIHLTDGGKTVVSVNNIAAEFPWQRQQQTVYGYIQSLDEVRTLNTGLIEANLTVKGM